MQTHHIIKLEYSDLGKHSSEIRGLCSMKCFSKNCLKFCNILRTTKKTPIIFFILGKFTFSSMNVQVYVDIDQRAMIREKIKLYKMNRQRGTGGAPGHVPHLILEAYLTKFFWEIALSKGEKQCDPPKIKPFRGPWKWKAKQKTMWVL